MRVFLDTNIVLDVALARQLWGPDSAKVFQWCIDYAHASFIAFHTFTNAYYVIRGQSDDSRAREFLSDLLTWVDLAPTSKQQLVDALADPAMDVEDTLQGICADHALADVIITRDSRGFSNATTTALSPAEFLSQNPAPQ